ncbi:hypothetical protein PVAND_011897 [Polypedilum vanderplanki]|uniref:Putative ionotropic receptor ligand binding domain-containing protein n=1 Tax=Polypedilum vanderplanki TaxID=319348 RepID=A0A9J6CKT9_POLVA|nr:hypothetical protein PVAND_011897 [Polypedilum vanderplanki]
MKFLIFFIDLALISLAKSESLLNFEVIKNIIESSGRNSISFIKCNEDLIKGFVIYQNLNLGMFIRGLKSPLKIQENKITSAVITISSLNDFNEISSLFSTENIILDGHFIIIFEKAIITDIEKIFTKLWKIYVYNVNVITTSSSNSENTILLYTFKPFINDFSCENMKPIKIIEYDMKSMQWHSKVFYPDKFKNLHFCPLKVGSFEKQPGFFTTKIKNEKIITGIEADLINIFGKFLNYKPIFNIYPSNMGTIHKNKTSTGLLKRVFENEIDVIIGTLSLQQSRAEYLSETHMIYNDKLVLVIPPPFLMNSLGKILLPFHIYTWISVGLFIFLVCVIIVTLKFTPQIFHDYIIGANVKCNILEVWNLLLGGAQKKISKSNFPRFLLAKFLIFALVIRSIYQGAIFDILKNDVSTVELKTIDEFIENKFTFYIYDSLAGRLNGTKYLQRYKRISPSEITAFEELTLDPSFKGVVFDYFTIVLYNNFLNRKKYSLKICKESLLTNQIVFYFTKNFYLVDEFNDLIGRFKSAGLIDHIMSNYIDMKLLNSIDIKKPATALTLENLEGIFKLLICALLIAILNFLLEIFYGNIKKKKKVNLKN